MSYKLNQYLEDNRKHKTFIGDILLIVVFKSDDKVVTLVTAHPLYIIRLIGISTDTSIENSKMITKTILTIEHSSCLFEKPKIYNVNLNHILKMVSL